jgi:photosynthetic reaction center H subunit
MSDQLMRLSDLDDFEVADESPDVRGWKVVGSDGQHLGEVDELIVDPVLMKVRYLEVEVRDHFQGGHTLVPIGLATVDKADEIVFLHECDTKAIEGYPRYSGEAITRDYVVSLRRALVPGVEAVRETDFYVHESFDEDRFYAGRKALDALDPRAGVSTSPRHSSSAIRKRSITGEETRLRQLSDSKDFEISNEQPDVRGWDVVDADGAINERSLSMNWDQIEGNWKQWSGKVKEKWGKLTDDDLTQMAGHRDQLVGRIQQAYGTTKDEAERQVKDWASALDRDRSDMYGNRGHESGSGAYAPADQRGYGDSVVGDWAGEALRGIERQVCAMASRVQKQPLASLAVAAGIGYIIGVLRSRR